MNTRIHLKKSVREMGTQKVNYVLTELQTFQMYAHMFNYAYHLSPAGIKPFPTDMFLSIFSLKNTPGSGKKQINSFTKI